jgi:hypothetical protein
VTVGAPPALHLIFEFDKGTQLFVCMHNVTLAVVPMRVSNPDRSPRYLAMIVPFISG